MVRELSKHQSAFLFDCCVVIARFASLSCYSSVKTRIRPVKLYHCPWGMPSKCSPPPNRPNRQAFSLPVSLIKSISVRASCGYLCGGFALPLSMQKLCILYRQDTKALTLLIGILAFKGDFSIRQWFVRIPNVHSMLIQTCD